MKNIFKKTFSAFTGAMVFLSAVSMSASAADKEIADILTNGSETSLISYASATPDMAMPDGYQNPYVGLSQLDRETKRQN